MGDLFIIMLIFGGAYVCLSLLDARDKLAALFAEEEMERENAERDS